jgi:hypothetical protein
LPPLADPFSFRLAFTPVLTPPLPAFSSRSFASCSVLRRALRSAFSFSLSRSALASARFFLRYFSQEAHLQPIGFR